MAEKDQDERLFSIVIWRLENLCSWKPEIHPPKFDSPRFKLNNLRGNYYNLRIILSHRLNSGIDISFWSFEYTFDIKLNLEWSILDGNGLPIFTTVKQYVNDYRIFSTLMPNPPTYADIFMNKRSLYLTNGALTVQLRIFNRDFRIAEHASVVTRVLTLEKSFSWRVERFSTLQLDEETAISVKVGKDDFKLFFFLKGSPLSDSDVCCRIVAKNVSEQRLNVKLSLLDKDGNETMNVGGGTHQFSSFIQEEIWLLSKILSRNQLLERASELLHGDCLTVRCKFASHRRCMVKYIEKYYCGYENLRTDIERNKNVPKKTEPKTVVATVPEETVQREDSKKRPRKKGFQKFLALFF